MSFFNIHKITIPIIHLKKIYIILPLSIVFLYFIDKFDNFLNNNNKTFENQYPFIIFFNFIYKNI